MPADRPASLTDAPPDYAEWLAGLKSRIHSAQQRATQAVNRELVLLYWQIGRDILARQSAQGWGAKVIDRLAHDLLVAFPDMQGFSARNLKYMRAFAQAWPDVDFVQGVLAQLPWYHQLALLDKLQTEDDRRWYAANALQHNWSRNVLVIQIRACRPTGLLPDGRRRPGHGAAGRPDHRPAAVQVQEPRGGRVRTA